MPTTVTPAVMPQQRPNMQLLPPNGADSRDELLELLAEAEKKLGEFRTELTAKVTALETKHAAAEREIRSLRRDLTAAEKRIGELEAGATAGPSEPRITRSEQTRRDVLAFFETLPRGVRMPPETVRKNIGYPKTIDGKPCAHVAQACIELREKGVLAGGGKRNQKDDPDFGLYWLPEEPAKDADQ